jgi:[ribosomal protein S5]-alanine N-acetyltransferase
LDAFQAYRHDEEVGRYQGWEPWSATKALTFLEAMSTVDLLDPGTWCQVGIAARESEGLIGDIGMCVRLKEHQAEIGFSLNAQWQGRGLATEAIGLATDLLFEQTAVDQIVCITDARNLAANRLLRRMRMDHVRTEDALFRGEPY